MITEYDPTSEFVRPLVDEVRKQRIASSVQLTVSRHESGIYTAELVRLRVQPLSLVSVELGALPEVPPGQRRATWLLTDAVNAALTSVEGHSLLHW